MSPTDQESLFRPWWVSLEQDVGNRAALRRCSDPTAVMMIPAYHRLYQKARGTFGNATRLAVAAAVLAHVREDVSGRSIARSAEGKLSEPRFRRLLTIDDPEELQVALIRTLRLIGSAAPVETLGRDIQFWGNNVKQRWAFDFYEEEQ